MNSLKDFEKEMMQLEDKEKLTLFHTMLGYIIGAHENRRGISPKDLMETMEGTINDIS
ncbi:hypothetical protein [Priestia megaterium]|uniref:hypothetical protein n=1 Tax=Priestia megaterium TaxID=1404 RepID=UPI003CC54DC2